MSSSSWQQLAVGGESKSHGEEWRHSYRLQRYDWVGPFRADDCGGNDFLGTGPVLETGCIAMRRETLVATAIRPELRIDEPSLPSFIDMTPRESLVKGRHNI